MIVRVISSALAVAILTVLLVMHLDDQVVPLLHKVGIGNINEQNAAYLDQAEEEAIATFLLLSGLKSGLALMESSSAGISFLVDVQVQVGQIVSSMKEVVNYGWSASMLGLAALTSMRILIECIDWINPMLFTALLGCLTLHYALAIFTHRFQRWTKELVQGSLFFLLLSTLVLPFSIFTGSLISEAITAPTKEKVRTELETEHKGLIADHKGGDLKSQAKHGISTYLSTSTEGPKKHRHLTTHIIMHLVTILFDVVLFPFASLLFLGTLIKRHCPFLAGKLAVQFRRGLPTEKAPAPILATT